MAIDYAALKAECQTDPTGLGLATPFSAKSWGVVASKLNAVNQTIDVNRTLVPSYEVFEATVQAEWAALSAADKQRYQTMLSMGQVNAAGTNTRAAFQAMFGAGTTTRTNLTALLTRKGSRAEQLFGTQVGDGDIEKASVS